MKKEKETKILVGEPMTPGAFMLMLRAIKDAMDSGDSYSEASRPFLPKDGPKTIPEAADKIMGIMREDCE